MNILITGAYGFVGTNLCNYLKSRGHTCSALDVKQGEAPYDAFYTWDALSSLPWGTYDAVVHLAGKAHDTKNTSSAQSYFDINFGLTQKVFSACSGKCKRFVFFSSVKASADRVEGILKEPSLNDCHPGTPYGESKLAAERWLGESLENNVYVLRPAMIHGPGNKGNLNLLCKIARYGLPWPLGMFENARSFTSIGNICAVVEALCDGQAAPGTYQVADDVPVSTNRLIELIAESVGKPPRIWRLPKGPISKFARIGDVFHLPLNSERLKKLTESYVVSNEKLKTALKWEKMPVGSEEGLRLTLMQMLSR